MTIMIYILGVTDMLEFNQESTVDNLDDELSLSNNSKEESK